MEAEEVRQMFVRLLPWRKSCSHEPDENANDGDEDISVFQVSGFMCEMNENSFSNFGIGNLH